MRIHRVTKPIRKVAGVLALVWLVPLACAVAPRGVDGAGGNGNSECGAQGQPCCVGSRCWSPSSCEEGVCVGQGDGGVDGQPPDAAPPKPDSGPSLQCGLCDQPCCEGQCLSPLSCIQGNCTTPKGCSAQCGVMGSPCCVDADGGVSCLDPSTQCDSAGVCCLSKAQPGDPNACP